MQKNENFPNLDDIAACMSPQRKGMSPPRKGMSPQRKGWSHQREGKSLLMSTGIAVSTRRMRLPR
ncbi:hypothetical protein MNKW57_19560 [Biformimicrobium ophioploci]|uniref:Uncharacterized protein n=1 Tax=Biformimicrobium ophioploci TaxID=3036711 RepID=A0ABQ6M033_9GAMM|nr:hypothetical protein MNKW57_19560 [Microbulbifer sp. NKW57]